MPFFRPHRFDVRIDEREETSALARSFAGMTHSTLTVGNAARIVQDGAFFDALLADCSAARSSIHFENYLWKPGQTFERVVAELAAAAARGVEVRIVYDALGAVEGTERRLLRLRESGCAVIPHRKLSLANLTRYNRRDHRKLVVIDGRAAWLFGHGVSDEWDPSVPADLHWRDTAVRLAGPIVNELQAAFLETWIELTGTAMAGERYFPGQPHPGGIAACVAYVTPVGVRSAVQRLHYVAIQASRKSISIQNPYFIPDRAALRYLRDARRRGVRVRLMLPKASRTDVPLVQHASHHFFGSLLAAGAEVFEYARSGLHQKILVVDGEWCCAGSTNFDSRSFRTNDEITVALFDPATAQELETAFDRDLRAAEPWTVGRWKARSRPHRLGDFSAALLRGQL